MQTKMFNRQDLPKLYHLEHDLPAGKLIKQEDKKVRKSSPVSTNEPKSIMIKCVETKPTELKSPESKTGELKSNESNELNKLKSDELNSDELKSNELKSDELKANESELQIKVESKSDETTKSTNQAFDLQTDERISDLEDRCDSKDESSAKDESTTSSNSAHNTPTKKATDLNISTLLDCINELKNNKSRVTKISLEKCIQRRYTTIPKNEIIDFVNRLLNDEILEKVKYRDYFGVRLRSTYKKTLGDDLQDDLDTNESDRLSVNDKSSFNDKSSTNDQDTMSNLDNLSDCSSNVNALNELNEELDDDLESSSYNTKKNSLKRCSPTIRYLLRNAPSEGTSAADMLKTLQTKRLLILYDLKKFVWLMKTYFVDKGICEQLANGNYRMNSNDDDNSNLSAINKSLNEIGDCKPGKHAKDDEISLFADEKFSDNENFDSDKQDAKRLDRLIEQVNRTSNYLTVQKVNDAIDQICQTTKNFSLSSILSNIDAVGLTVNELAAFLNKCCNLDLLTAKDVCSDEIRNSITKNKLLDRFTVNDVELKKVISSLKILLMNNVLSPDLMLIGLKTKFKLLEHFNLVSFNDLIRDRLLGEGFLQELPNNQFKLVPEIIEEISNQSTPNLETEYTDFEMDTTNYGDKLGLKRKMKSKDDSTLRRPISQRKKIKKSLGPDFLDPSGLKYQNLRNSYEDKCEICFKNTDRNMIECKKCKFKAHRLCLSEFDLVFKNNFKRFECEACRAKCGFCNQETEKLMNDLNTCKKCNTTYHIKCLLNKSEIEKTTKNCTTCEKTFFKHLMNKADKSTSNKTDLDKQNDLDIDINEASSNDINVRSNILEEVPTLVQLKEIEMTENRLAIDQQAVKRTILDDKLLDGKLTTEIRSTEIKSTELRSTENRSPEIRATENRAIENRSPEIRSTENRSPEIRPTVDSTKESNQSEANSLNDESNEDSNQSNPVSSLASLNSNLENTTRNLKADEETLIQKYRKLFKAYDVHQQVKITKEQFNTLKSLNSYSNGKNPAEWTVDDVVDFIASVGFPQESLIFKKEEIDGKSLLLLRRNDVLTGLSMHLGPALKIYSHIYKLQASV